jgi:hypothetical protein
MIEMIDLVYVGERIMIAGHEILPGALGCLPVSVYNSDNYPGWVPVNNSIQIMEQANEIKND